MLILQNYDGYTDQWDLIKDKNQSFVQQLVLDFINSFSYDPESDGDISSKVANSTEQMIEFAQEYIVQLSQAIENVSSQVEKTLLEDYFYFSSATYLHKCIELKDKELAEFCKIEIIK